MASIRGHSLETVKHQIKQNQSKPKLIYRSILSSYGHFLPDFVHIITRFKVDQHYHTLSFLFSLLLGISQQKWGADFFYIFFFFFFL